ncbi:MAG: hemolysin family protein [[Clostridium] fimetarium]|nr:hemolysin family protein [Alistipes timonensis]MCM1405132.1 hemolysin family protein [[Clostridium] fimetarium]
MDVTFDPVWLAITLVSLAFSALFSGIEIAFVTGDRVRVELDVQQGGIKGKALNMFYSNSEFFISTILVGNNIALVVYGMGAAKFIEPWLESHFASEALVLLFQTLISTGIILITGEFLPKTIFRINPNLSLRMVAPFTALIYMILYPVSLFTTWLSKSLMRLCGVKSDSEKLGLLTMTDLNEYLEQTIDENAEKKAAVENEVKIFHNALDFSQTHLRDCMTPRNEIVAVDIEDTTREELSKLFTESGRSKILVYRGDIDNVVGYIHVSELFRPGVDWREQVKEVVFAPETLMANKMMRRLLAEKRSIAIIVDEFGGTAGMVTLEDLVEEICGDIQDEHDSTSLVERRLNENTWEFSGRTEIEYLNEKYHFDIPEDDEYQTLAGYILTSTGKIPDTGDIIELGNLRLEVTRKSATRLELITVTLNP